MVVGRLLSYWEGNFSGAMLIREGIHLGISACSKWHIDLCTSEIVTSQNSSRFGEKTWHLNNILKSYRKTTQMRCEAGRFLLNNLLC